MEKKANRRLVALWKIRNVDTEMSPTLHRTNYSDTNTGKSHLSQSCTVNQKDYM